jgi:hypothetical protein
MVYGGIGLAFTALVILRWRDAVLPPEKAVV